MTQWRDDAVTGILLASDFFSTLCNEAIFVLYARNNNSVKVHKSSILIVQYWLRQTQTFVRLNRAEADISRRLSLRKRMFVQSHSICPGTCTVYMQMKCVFFQSDRIVHLGWVYGGEGLSSQSGEQALLRNTLHF